eukprot:CAMPEP_0119331446 /NCGR_PEP_ID=MMETSP1333-20130426/80645_1 /TAXON_ID=418940 /ORGANISM="Scyphosphaera apsteinii, Strain RCC1455" /LENGTH=917 /DNA_ID=CAMNT_0007341055 /DNA_START=129 /DNA_END=2882 /DNA_ORIENTATION=+
MTSAPTGRVSTPKADAPTAFALPSPEEEAEDGRGQQLASRRRSMPFAEADMTSLLSRLEQLDEERHDVTEQMRRLQLSELQDTAMPEDMLLPSSRARFSRHTEIRENGQNVKQQIRRQSATTNSRISSYMKREPPADDGIEDKPTELSELIAMVARGRLRARYNHRQVDGPEGGTQPDCVTYLPRGGVYVKTKYCVVQFGLPPETIKDSLRLNLDVPHIYVVPKDRFNLKFGTNTCEAEFPAYWNFFIKGSTTTLLCTSDAANIIRQVVDEVLEGPCEEFLYADDEYSAYVDPKIFEARPNHLKEIKYFKEPRNGRVISTSTLINFAIFEYNADGNLEAALPADGGSLSVVDIGNQYQVVVDGEVVAQVDDYLASAIADPPHILMPSRSSAALTTMEEFETPHFGVTVLGSADGFTKDGTTAGFVLWMRGRGILVDPPAHSAHYLTQNGISSRKITHVILTHCHADHDAGTFQKILLEQRVTVMTTKTIMASFIRKYALVSSMPEDFLLRLFVFHSVKVAEPVHFQGGTIRFHYSLHALPCIGFRAELAGKSISYSGDTYYDPEGLLKLQERGVISEARRFSLLEYSEQEADLLLHEAGIAPIHTPVAALKQLPEAVRKSLRIIHVNDKNAAEAGIELARSGFENTIRVQVPSSEHAHATNILQILLATDLFRSLDVATAIEVLQVTRERSYGMGEIICSKDTPGDFLRIIKAGTVSLDRDGVQRDLRYCDYFGEIELLTACAHPGTATASTRVEMIEINKADTQYLMSRRPNLKERVMRRAKLRYGASWTAIGANSVFSHFSMSQVTQLQSVMQEEKVRASQTIWRKGDKVKDVILIGEGKFQFKELLSKDNENDHFTQGALLVDVYALEHKLKHQLNFAALTDGKVFRIDGDDLLEFLDNNPGAFIWMRDTLVVI